MEDDAEEFEHVHISRVKNLQFLKTLFFDDGCMYIAIDHKCYKLVTVAGHKEGFFSCL